MLKQKLGDRFSNIFNRDKKEKQEESRKDQQVYFNESYFECKLVYNPHRLSLIKVIANIMVGPDAGTPMMASCKWLIKKNGQYSEIQGVTSSCYQPCIEDVGCSVLVQITPLIEGKIYSGATIAKQTGPLELGSTLETRFTETKNKLYYQKQQIQFSTKIQAVFGKQTEYSSLEYPQDGRLLIRKHEDANFEVEVITQEFKTYFWITKQFPTVEFIRKSYNSVVVSFTEFQSMRLAFKEGSDREILGLLLRTLTANSTLDWKIKDSTQQEDNQAEDSNQNFVNSSMNDDEIKIVELEQNPSQTMKTSLLKSQKKLDSFSQINMTKVQEKDMQNVQKSTQKLQISPQKSQNLSVINNQGVQQLTFTSPIKSQQNLPIQLTPVSPSVNAFELELKIGELNIELNKIRKQYKELMKNYNIEKQNKCKLEHQVKKSNDKLIQFQKIQKERDDALLSNEKLKEDNRFLRNQVALLNKNLKKKQQDLQSVNTAKQALETKIQKQEITKNETNKADNDYLNNQAENWRKLNNELTEQNQDLKSQIQKLENNLKTVNKKLESLSHEKMIGNQQYPKSEPTIPVGPSLADLAQKDKIISNLETKITNLQMLVKHRIGEKGNESLALHKIINSMTEDITEKEEQLEHAKKLNKQLAQKIQNLTKALSDK